MKESARLARSAVRARLEKYGVAPDFFEKHDVHIHVPEGAVPKDGPSAGRGAHLRADVGRDGHPREQPLRMTGEITLHGRALPIGGVKEKLLAAYRMGITEILLPAENEKDLEKIDGDILSRFTVHKIASVDEALEAVLVRADDNGMRIAI